MIFNINTMKTIFNIPYQKKIAFLILSVFSFSLFAFTNNTERGPIHKSILIEEQLTIVITKKTTKEELEIIKKQMMDEGLGFNYSNVVYNDKDEIIAISISYKDANNNSGNYSVSSQNPINTILIKSDGKSISVKSEGSSNQAFINQGSGFENPNMEKSRADRRQAMQERSDEMKKEMDERMQEMKERHSQMKARNQTRMENSSHRYPIKEFNGNSYIITKNSTDSELLKLQKIFESENISFSYKNLQHNAKNEITHIAITIDNNNGSISKSTFGNGSDPIKDITVAVDAQHTIMKSAE